MDEGSARVVNVEGCEVCELTHVSEISCTTKPNYKISDIVTHDTNNISQQKLPNSLQNHSFIIPTNALI